MGAQMGIATLALALMVAACTPVPDHVLPSSQAPFAEASCQPTVAHMVPPQRVMDFMIAGMSPQPSTIPTLEQWAAQGNWVGNDVLWVSLPPDGVFDRRYSKLWMLASGSGPIAISGQRLDGDRAGSLIGSASAENPGSSVEFSKAGCWRVVYELDGRQLRFTLRVVDGP